MRKDTTTYKVIRFIFQAGQVRESDIRMFFRSRYASIDNVSKAIASLKSNGFIETKEYALSKSYHKGDTDTVLSLTRKGKAVVLDTEKDDYYLRILRSQRRKFFTEKAEGTQTEPERIDRLLTDNGILAMFAANDIPVFQHEKPSLFYLKEVLSNNPIVKTEGYLDNLAKNECQAFLDKGIYYSESEILEYANKLSENLSDTISGTRIRGVFVSTLSCFAVFVSRKFDNKILRVNIKGEKGLINALKSFDTFTKVFREIPEFNEYDVSAVTGNMHIKTRFFNEPYALIFSDGEMLAYSTATGNSKGLVKKVDIALSTEKRERILSLKPSGDNSSKASTYLTAASSLYSKIYVIPTNINGMYSLKYLLSNPLEDYRSDGIEIMKKSKEFDYDKNSLGIFPYRKSIDGVMYDVTYIPVFEAKALYEISKASHNPVIITYADLLNPIAHSIRKESRYFDAASLQFFDKDAVLIYDEYGHIKGENMLDSFLKIEGLTFNKREERFNLPRRYGLGYIEFYNSVARGEIKLEELADLVLKKEYIPRKRTHVKTEIISVAMPKNIALKLKNKAKEEDISVSKYICQCVIKSLDS